MITRADLVDRAREWSLREDVVEKDYVLGWLLWAIGIEPGLNDRWVFKGGTCLKKCYVETFRFSEDLDFTVLPGTPLTEDGVLQLLGRALAGRRRRPASTSRCGRAGCGCARTGHPWKDASTTAGRAPILRRAASRST